MRRGVALFAIALVHLAGAWAIWDLEVKTDITEFMPESENAGLAELSRELTHSDLSRNMTLTIVGEVAQEPGALREAQLDAVTQTTRAFADRLAESTEVDWVRGGPDGDLQEAFYTLYFPYRLGLVDVDFSETALRQRAEVLKARLASPMGAFVRRLAADDPLLLFLQHMESLQATLGGHLEVRDGVFVSMPPESTGTPVADSVEAEVAGVVLLSSAHSPLDGAATRRLLADIDDAFEAANAASGGEQLRLEYAGVHAIALDSEEAIRADISRVSIAGALGVALIILLLFRSLRMLLLAGIPIVGGMMVALAVTRLAFGSIHGLTLAFGATLIGVALDYVVHLMNHHYLRGASPSDGAAEHQGHKMDRRDSGSASRSLQEVRGGLLLGAATTIAGLLGLAWTSFPGIRQMAVFTSVGIATALLLTMIVLPAFMPHDARPGGHHLRFSRRLAEVFASLQHRRGLLKGVFAVAAIFAVVSVPFLSWEDDMRALSPVSAEREARDAAIRARVAQVDQGRLVFVRADTMAEALELNDAAAAALSEAKVSGFLGEFRSLSALLPSENTQTQRIARYDATRFVDVMRAFEAEGFVAAPFEPFQAFLNEPHAPLTFAQLEASPLADLASAHQLEAEDGDAIILTFLRDVHDPERVSESLDHLEGAGFFDQGLYMSSAYSKLRSRTLELVSVGLVVVFLLLLLRYRHLRRCLAAFVPAALAAACTLGVFAVFGVRVHLLHVVCLLLVLSMGVDYGVFMVEASVHQADEAADFRVGNHLGSTFTSVVVACLSTFASFGVLAASDHPALFAIGATAAIGVTLSLLFAPLATLLATPAEARALSHSEQSPE